MRHLADDADAAAPRHISHLRWAIKSLKNHGKIKIADENSNGSESIPDNTRGLPEA